MPNNQYIIGANDEHGVNPPTAGKRTPVMPNLNRQIYENEFNRAAKNAFIEACLRNGFRVFDVKSEWQDIPVPIRVSRVNRQDLTLLVTFAYNAFGRGTTFNSASGVTVYYATANRYPTASRQLAEEVYVALLKGTAQRGLGVQTLGDVGILQSVNCPSVLVEAGFMTNLAEAQLMLDPDFITEVGEETCQGVCNYLETAYIPRSLDNLATLRNGSTGSLVQLLQFVLSTNYGYSLEIDGVFGAQTRNAVVAFQKENGLAPDGVVGPNTWRTLLVLPPYPTLREGSRGAYVSYMQSKLESYLFPVGGIDGVFGTRTLSAVRAFQADQGLTPDGVVGPLTWAELTRSRDVV